MQRNQPTIYISSKSMKKLRPLILPFMCTSMKYKLGDFSANLQQSYQWLQQTIAAILLILRTMIFILLIKF